MSLNKIITKFLTTQQIAPTNLGRWNTMVTQKIKERRIDLANIDCCVDEICSNPPTS